MAVFQMKYLGALLLLFCCTDCVNSEEGYIRLNMPMREKRKEEGDTVSMVCKITGIPTPTYTWYKNGSPISSGGNRRIKSTERGSRLSLRSLQVSDTGNYQCRANNSFGESTTTASLTVRKTAQESPLNVYSGRPRPYFQDTDQIFRVYEGGTAVLPCAIGNLGSHKVVWTDKRHVLLTVDDRRITDDTRISIERPFAKDWNLHIRSVSSQDQGNYTCQINTEPVISRAVQLVLTGGLEIIAKSETTRSTDGSRVRLFCKVARIPGSTKYYWKRSGHTLDPEEDRYRMSHSLYNTTLVIMPVNGQIDNTTFTCVAITERERAEADMDLIVAGESVPFFHETNQTIRVVEGDTAVLPCSVGNLGTKQVVWKKDQMSGPLSISGYVFTNDVRISVDAVKRRYMDSWNLQIRAVSLQDAGNYSCQVTAKTVMSRTVQLIVSKAETCDDTIPPMCRDMGYSSTRYPNSLNHQSAEDAGLELHQFFPLVEVECSPAFKPFLCYVYVPPCSDQRMPCRSLCLKARSGCQPLMNQYGFSWPQMFDCNNFPEENCLSTDTSPALDITLEGPPGQPNITGNNPNQAVRANDTVRLVCTSASDSLPGRVVWVKDKQVIDDTFTSGNNKIVNELTFTAQPSDNGAEYRCEVSLSPGTSLVASITLIVHFDPVTVNISGTRTAKVGETVTLTCTTSSSNPPAMLTWYHEGAQLTQDMTRTKTSTNGGYITMSYINVTLTPQQDNSVYTCQAQNTDSGMTVTDTAIVSVSSPVTLTMSAKQVGSDRVIVQWKKEDPSPSLTNVHVVLESLNVTVRSISIDSDATFAIVSHLDLNKKYTITLHLLFDDPAGLHTQSLDFHLDGRSGHSLFLEDAYGNIYDKQFRYQLISKTGTYVNLDNFHKIVLGTDYSHGPCGNNLKGCGSMKFLVYDRLGHTAGPVSELVFEDYRDFNWAKAHI